MAPLNADWNRQYTVVGSLLTTGRVLIYHPHISEALNQEKNRRGPHYKGKVEVLVHGIR